jgi:regulator of sirC expression with transglutaminase-like and TPR domain
MSTIPPVPSLRDALARGAELDELWWIVSSDATPTTALGAVRDELDRLAAGLREAMLDRTSVGAISDAQILVAHVHGELRFAGNQDAYHDPRNSLVSDVLSRRLGIPITLALVLVEMGRRAGMNVHGVGFPGHFLAKVERDGSEILVDPFAGTILGRAMLERLALRTTGAARVAPEQLVAASREAIVVRMLRNLKHAYELRGDRARAMVATDRLVDLTASMELRRDRGLHALALGARSAAIDDLEAYLAATPDAPDRAEVGRAIARARRPGSLVLQ